MMLDQRFNFFAPPQFNLATNTALGTRQSWPIDRTWPIEEIVLHVGFSVTTPLQPAPQTATTPDGFDNILQLISRINLSINEGQQPRSVIDCSGIGLLEHCSQVGFSMDAATMALVGFSTYQTPSTIVNGVYELTYRIPMVHPAIGEPLRSRMYLPVHRYPQDPILTLTFNTIAGMNFSAGVIGQIFVDVELIRRVPTPQSEALLRATAPKDQPKGLPIQGYVPFDLIETSYQVPLGSNADVRFALPIPGQYSSLVFRQYRGGATINRSVIDNSGAGDSVANGFGSETRWRLETGSVVLRDWRWKHLRALNDFSRPGQQNGSTIFVAAASAGSPTTITNICPNFGGNFMALTNFRPASSVALNFLNDGLSGDINDELGSLLDCNTPANNGLKMEIIGTPASVATNASQLLVVGHRFFGDLSRWQLFQ